MPFSRDTTPEARAFLIKRTREMTPAEKSRRMWALTHTARELSLSGLRGRYPKASAAEIHWRFIALLHGTETARKMLGWDPDENGDGNGG